MQFPKASLFAELGNRDEIPFFFLFPLRRLAAFLINASISEKRAKETKKAHDRPNTLSLKHNPPYLYMYQLSHKLLNLHPIKALQLNYPLGSSEELFQTHWQTSLI